MINFARRKKKKRLRAAGRASGELGAKPNDEVWKNTGGGGRWRGTQSSTSPPSRCRTADPCRRARAEAARRVRGGRREGRAEPCKKRCCRARGRRPRAGREQRGSEEKGRPRRGRGGPSRARREGQGRPKREMEKRPRGERQEITSRPRAGQGWTKHVGGNRPDQSEESHVEATPGRGLQPRELHPTW